MDVTYGEISWGKMVEAFVGEDQDFVNNPVCDGKPVKVFQDRGRIWSELGGGQLQLEPAGDY